MKLLRFWPILLIVALALVGNCYLEGVRNSGVLKEQISQDKKTIAAYKEAIIAMGSRLPRIDTVAGEAKTVYLKKKVDYKHIADSITAALAAIGEEPPPVIAACNAALAAADTAMSKCAMQVAVRDSLLRLGDSVVSAQDSLIKHLQKKAPFLVQIGKPTIPYVLGIITGLIIKGGKK